MIINNFEVVQIANPLVQPPYLTEFDVIDGYQIFHSSFDNSLYVIYDHVKKQYNVFRRVVIDANIQVDLEKVISVIFKADSK